MSVVAQSGDGACKSAYCEIVGYSVEELKYDIADINYKDDVKEQRTNLENICGELENTGLKTIYHKNGRLVWADVTVTRLWETGKPTYILIIIQDITDRKMAEEKIIKLNNELEEKVLKEPGIWKMQIMSWKQL